MHWSLLAGRGIGPDRKAPDRSQAIRSQVSRGIHRQSATGSHAMPLVPADSGTGGVETVPITAVPASSLTRAAGLA